MQYTGRKIMLLVARMVIAIVMIIITSMSSLEPETAPPFPLSMIFLPVYSITTYFFFQNLIISISFVNSHDMIIVTVKSRN